MKTCWLLAAALLVASCTAANLQRTRETVAATWNCPYAELNVTEVHDGWLADGCGRKVLCRNPEGPCVERLSFAQKLARARDAFSRETQCPVPDITVTDGRDGFIAQGCGRYSVCTSYDGPCMPSRPPSCAELAQQRYDGCLAQAHQKGESGRRSAYNNYAGLALSIGSTVAETQMVDACRQQYEQEAKACGTQPP